MLTSEEYLEHKGEICPYCKGMRLDWLDLEQYNGVCQKVRCRDCRKEWWDVYKLDRFEPVRD